MNSWYYSQADQAVGPFQMEVLSKLVQLGVISDATLVKQAEDTEWQALATMLATATPQPPAVPSQKEARYFYLNAVDQPVGPFDVSAIQRLYADKVVWADTLVSGIGEPEWIPAARLLNLPGDLAPASSSAYVNAHAVHPRHLPFEQYVKMMGITLSFYFFYLVPCQSRDLKAITGRARLEFLPLLILGIVTLGLVPLVVIVLWAYDLERHGKAFSKTGRRESLGTIVLVLSGLCLLSGFIIDSFLLSFVVSALLSGGALWLLQREINLYAVAPAVPATSA